jgi:mono/diheme cytochrome c family protein
MKIFMTVVITLAALMLIGLVFIYSGVYNVAGINPPCKLESWFFSTVMDNSVEHHSKGITAPALDDAAMVDSGFVLVSQMCVGCHGAPGVPPRGRGFNPEPPDLSKGVADLSDAEIFWIVKNGIKMTAMPAYGPKNDDSKIWKMVSFVRKLPLMTPEQYRDFDSRLGRPEQR